MEFETFWPFWWKLSCKTKQIVRKFSIQGFRLFDSLVGIVLAFEFGHNVTILKIADVRGKSSPYNHTPKSSNCGEQQYVSECQKIQCARCCEFGHFAKGCRNDPKCFRSGLADHFSKD